MIDDNRRVLPAERGVGCIAGVLAVPTMVPMTALVGALVKGGKVTRAVALPLIFILFLITAIVLLPYFLILRLLGKAGLVRMQLPPSCNVIHREPGSCRLDLMVPQDDRETAASMLKAVVERIASAADVAVDADGEIELVAQTEHGREAALKLTFANLATLEAQIYVDQGNFNAEILVTGDERCIDAAMPPQSA